MACTECNDSKCEGVNKLREFASWEDLSAHLSEAKILEFVNGYWGMRMAQKEQGARYRTKQQALAKVAKKLLDPDELELIARQAAEKVESGTVRDGYWLKVKPVAEEKG